MTYVFYNSSRVDFANLNRCLIHSFYPLIQKKLELYVEKKSIETVLYLLLYNLRNWDREE
ncbi:hypothetical protein BH23THE1_BH23THE1_30880 [soil metagenome]